MNSHAPIKGVALIAVVRQGDQRGHIAIFDRDLLPFVPVRLFTIFDVPLGASRGGHSLSCDEFLWVAAGSCRISFDNGAQKSSLMLESGAHGVLVSAGIWLELTDFTPGTIVFGFAPMPYSDTKKFGTPRPDLIGERTKACDPTGRP